jgi:hypothetical protein
LIDTFSSRIYLIFYQEIVATSGEKILISGDIAEVPSVSAILKVLIPNFLT